MVANVPAAARAWSAARPFAWACVLAAGLLVAAVATRSATADHPALTSLLKSLDLRGYASRTAPPQFKGVTLDARHVSLTERRGAVIVLNFWASWCLDCRPEMAMLERLQRDFASRGLIVLGINVREDKEAVGRYARELGLTFPLVFDPDGKINSAYGVIGLPTTFVVGRDGRAVAFAIGPRSWETAPARALIEALLSEPAPPKAAE